MGRYINKHFLAAAGILALLSAEIKVNSALTDPTTTEEEYVTEGPDLLATTEEEYVTEGPDLLATTEEEYVTEGPDLLATTEEEYVTEGPDLLATTEEEYVTEGPDLVAVIKEIYITNGTNPPSKTMEKEYTTVGANPFSTTTKDSGHSPAIKSTKCRDLWIFLIIIGILTVLCTILLVSTIALAYQVSHLKTHLKKRPTRSNSDFVKAASLWPTGPSQLAGESAEDNITLEEVRLLKDEEEAKPSKE